MTTTHFFRYPSAGTLIIERSESQIKYKSFVVSTIFFIQFGFLASKTCNNLCLWAYKCTRWRLYSRVASCALKFISLSKYRVQCLT